MLQRQAILHFLKDLVNALSKVTDQTKNILLSERSEIITTRVTSNDTIQELVSKKIKETEAVVTLKDL